MPAWIELAARWLIPRRLRAQATVLALCLWGVCAVDFATRGPFDRAGNIKFQDFLPSYVSAQLVAQGRANELYNQQVTADEMQTAIPPISARDPTRPILPSLVLRNLVLPNLYGPQVGLFFVPLARFSFPVAARIWVAASVLLFFACVYLVGKVCPALRPHFAMVALCALAFPPLFHFFVRAQLSALVLACFTAAFLAFRADRTWLAGVALGFLIFKPQFLVALPLVLLLAHAWKPLTGLILAAGAQLVLARIYFGPAVMNAYFDTLWHMSRVIGASELSLAPIQMHSLRSFWTLLIPWPEIALALYVLTSIVTVILAAAVWKSFAPLSLRFSALTLAAVLVNPHLFVYDLLVLAPALLLLADRTLANAQHSSSPTLRLLTYLAFVLPLFGPLSRWSHLQLSVPAFAALLWILWRSSGTPDSGTPEPGTPGHKLASN
ncbi:MAG: glycosyltransferase family 87 protein [Candidatus Sulfotelmatobacter sp.]